jgi:lipopolysaccharide transport system permease protein
MSSPAHPSPLTVIEPAAGWQPIHLGELWRYRELLWILAVRDIKVRYKQTVLGAAWAVIQPVATMVVFSLFFGHLAGVPSDGIPYPIFAYAALLPWQLFAGSITQAGNSLVGSQHLITKVYFPRLVIPISSMLCGLLDFLVSSVVLFAMMFYYHVIPSWRIVTLPFFLLLAIASSLAVGLWLSALNVKYRDVRYVIPFLTQFWMFITPIAYPSSLVPEKWRWLYGLNPMAGVVEGFRFSLLGRTAPTGSMMLASVLASAFLLIGGLFYFRRTERSFADIV